MKGVLLTRAPGVHIVDITHEIPRHDIAAGAHALTNAVPFFPPGTIHICVVDPGVGTDRKPVIVVDKDQYLIGPDNGIFSLVAPRPTGAYEISESAFRRDRPSATFHGRDIFAAAAAELARGGKPEAAGPQVVLRGKIAAESAPGGLSLTVAHIDVFGNLITNLAAERIPPGVTFRVAGRDIGPVRTTFESVGVGELLAYVGSRQTLEIAVRNGNAAEMLGASRGTLIEVVPTATDTKAR
jgi:S-adenosylmethionine hydrolase